MCRSYLPRLGDIDIINSFAEICSLRHFRKGTMWCVRTEDPSMRMDDICFRYATRMLIDQVQYRDRLKGMQMLLSRAQAGPGRRVKEEQK